MAQEWEPLEQHPDSRPGGDEAADIDPSLVVRQAESETDDARLEAGGSAVVEPEPGRPSTGRLDEAGPTRGRSDLVDPPDADT